MTDIENLYERYAGDVRRFALYLSGDVGTADDITSDTFVRAWMAADRIRQPTVKSYFSPLHVTRISMCCDGPRAIRGLIEERSAK
jgi:hypothetical protein